MKFRLEATFEADDLDDAINRLAAHWAQLARALVEDDASSENHLGISEIDLRRLVEEPV